VQATVYRIEALNEAVKVEVRKGQKAHTWLTQSEVKYLLDSCNTRTIQGKRDKIVLGLLVGLDCGGRSWSISLLSRFWSNP
jgi:hypothetical protein